MVLFCLPGTKLDRCHHGRLQSRQAAQRHAARRCGHPTTWCNAPTDDGTAPGYEDADDGTSRYAWTSGHARTSWNGPYGRATWNANGWASDDGPPQHGSHGWNGPWWSPHDVPWAKIIPLLTVFKRVCLCTNFVAYSFLRINEKKRKCFCSIFIS